MMFYSGAAGMLEVPGSYRAALSPLSVDRTFNLHLNHGDVHLLCIACFYITAEGMIVSSGCFIVYAHTQTRKLT